MKHDEAYEKHGNGSEHGIFHKRDGCRLSREPVPVPVPVPVPESASAFGSVAGAETWTDRADLLPRALRRP
ncbi:hypothetical protein [Streptomyces sp. NPDC088736]|uniref:hypothetical protein n=1 Tax=Streptomyces sp. NPDC088736 TaxID=3365881 RepID=UPI00382E8345